MNLFYYDNYLVDPVQVIILRGILDNTKDGVTDIRAVTNLYPWLPIINPHQLKERHLDTCIVIDNNKNSAVGHCYVQIGRLGRLNSMSVKNVDSITYRSGLRINEPYTFVSSK